MSGTESRARSRAKKRRLSRAVALGFALVFLLAVVATAIPILLFAAIAPPTTAFMLVSRVADPATGQSCDVVDHSWVDLETIAPDLGLAVLVAEDQRFFEHAGFDLNAIDRALSEHFDGGRLRGASTISQQVAKNLFLWPGRSLTRKGLEVWFTAWLEWVWTKRRILEVYLNIAQFGPCLFGAEAASDRYFNAEAVALSPREAALLAAVLPNPKRLRAADPGPYTSQRSLEILELMDWHRDKAIGRQLARITSSGN
ncbi:MAG: monofunctional biosynthetic peptidoglycan transglycosylase [Deltaproteobacteria bacterium]|jgi:monofunctional biosynthetic peptidoglycan transglycosylase|nr:monofunctional biosynthetic peptidoglycan transglycosylase [Deltaproteobacteria bacterium]MBW2540465.1 monofunctional biosynthetic peptidoglycan transglycosylase [Deltaproteobacteria bacterium]